MSHSAERLEVSGLNDCGHLYTSSRIHHCAMGKMIRVLGCIHNTQVGVHLASFEGLGGYPYHPPRSCLRRSCIWVTDSMIISVLDFFFKI